jgi:hypothetical protein
MSTKTIEPYQCYRPWRRSTEIGAWLAFFVINTLVNAFVSLLAMRRGDSDFPAWEPAVWEASSSILLLLLLPAVIWLTRWFPLHWDTWRARLPIYVGASVVFSVFHVSGMVGLRVLAYKLAGGDYDFGTWMREFLYEYLKDVRTFAAMVLVIETYRFLLRRWQGEASLLDVPDCGPPVEPVDRPERFLVRKLGREFLVAASDIEWLQASGNYVNLHVAGRDYPLRSTIASIETKLDPKRFRRVHRSHIVNLDCIASIEPLDSGDARLHMKDASAIPCSRRYRADLRGHVAAFEVDPSI